MYHSVKTDLPISGEQRELLEAILQNLEAKQQSFAQTLSSGHKEFSLHVPTLTVAWVFICTLRRMSDDRGMSGESNLYSSSLISFSQTERSVVFNMMLNHISQSLSQNLSKFLKTSQYSHLLVSTQSKKVSNQDLTGKKRQKGLLPNHSHVENNHV